MSKRKLKRLDKKEERGNTIRVQEESAGVKTRIVGKEAGIQASSGKTYFAPCIILIMIALIIFMGYMKYQQALWNSDPHESEFARHVKLYIYIYIYRVMTIMKPWDWIQQRAGRI